ALGGLWHGASWNFVLWGVFHGTLLMIQRVVRGSRHKKLFYKGIGRFLAIFATFHLVCLGWILFRAPSLGAATDVAIELFSATRRWGVVTRFEVSVVAVALAWLSVLQFLAAAWPRLNPGWRRVACDFTRPFLYAALILAIALFCNRGSQAFIYFQ